MVTNLQEGSSKRCERYWPESGTADYGPYSVTLAEQQVLANYTIRTLELCFTAVSEFPEWWLQISTFHLCIMCKLIHIQKN